MDFLMNAFFRSIERYPFKYRSKRNEDGTYYLDFYDIPIELDFELLNLTYEVVSETEELQRKKRYMKETKEAIHICEDRKMKDGTRTIHIEFNKDDYAIKTNKIGSCIRTFVNK